VTCHLYIIAHLIDGKLAKPIKVGISQKPRSRISSLQTGNPLSLDFAFVFDLPDRHIAKSMEGAFHSLQGLHRLAGEWFDIDPIKAVQLFCAYLRVAMAINLDETDYLLFAERSGLNKAELLIANVTGAVH